MHSSTPLHRARPRMTLDNPAYAPEHVAVLSLAQLGRRQMTPVGPAPAEIDPAQRSDRGLRCWTMTSASRPVVCGTFVYVALRFDRL